jgi:enamine deaminase RidA (YjgF/YER057c/UK114 family)
MRRGPYERLRALNLTLPQLPTPIGKFVHGVEHNGLLYLSGQGPLLDDGRLATGKVGRDFNVEDAREHAHRAGLVLLAAMEEMLGSLDNVERIVKILGMVNAEPDFVEHPEVINGCSALFMLVFGVRGRHARSAIGVSSLPGNITVEIEAVVAATAGTKMRLPRRKAQSPSVSSLSAERR